ncbi:MAG: prepilin-type N-terminal cleavage/methylation domain-containing protein [Rhodocyclaceae bacterium]|nr:prepilin-type N-terminal cleavage/methylation domain-containing protein [Rhodocyclaceae bacterium]
MKVRGFTLLELLLVLAMGSGLLLGVAYMLNLGMTAHRSGTAEAEARQSLEFAMEHIGRALRETQDVLIPNTSMLNRNNTDPTKNALAVSLSPVLDANADDFMDADDNREGVLDEEVRKFVTLSSPQYPLRTDNDLPADATNDNRSGIRGVDDDGDGLVDEEDVTACWSNLSNVEQRSSCTDFVWWPYANDDWLNAVVFMVQQVGGINSLIQRMPTPKSNNGKTWDTHILARDVSSVSGFTVKLDKTAARHVVEVTLCLDVLDVNRVKVRSPVCALRRWRVGGGA